MRILEQEAMMNEAEVLAYDRLTRKYLEILHAGFVETVINLSPYGGKYLDVGTGTGWIAIGVAKHATDCHVTGIDLSENMLAVASQNAADEHVSNRVSFQLGDASGLPFVDETFDAVFCHNMLHHIPEPITLLKEMKRVAKKDGAIAIRDLIRYSRFVANIHVKIFGFTYNKLMKKEYLDSILASLTPNEWKDMAAEAELKNIIISRQFITHQSILRPAVHRRTEYISVLVPPIISAMKSLYVSKP